MTRLIRPFFAIAILFALSAPAGCEILTGIVVTDSGLTGIVQAGPTCPVVRPGIDCADRPVVATVIVRSAVTGLEAARFTSDTDGGFRVGLLPGSYLLDPQPASCCIGVAPTQMVDVSSGQFTNVVIEYDTGIR